MPLSVPGLKRWIGSFGQLGSTSDQVRGRREDLGQLLQGHVHQEGVLRADHDRHAVGADAEPDWLAADGLAGGQFIVLDRAAGVGDIGLARLAEALEAGTGADAVDGDVAGVAFVTEQLGHGLTERVDGRTPGRDDVALHRGRIDRRKHCLLRRGGFGDHRRLGGCSGHRTFSRHGGFGGHRTLGGRCRTAGRQANRQCQP